MVTSSAFHLRLGGVGEGRVYSYRICGFSVGSEVVLPGATPCAADRSVDVSIHRQAVPYALANPRASSDHWQIAGDRLLIRMTGIARFLLTAGREIAFEMEPDAPPEDAAAYLGGGIFGALLHQRGTVVLHASAVEVRGKAVLFCGPSGAGKSTLAAALVERGYRLVTDDLCAVSVEQTPTVHPDGRDLKLWAPSIQALALAGRSGPPVHRRLGKRYVPANDSRSIPLPIGALYFLCEAENETAAIERATAVDAMRLVMANAHKPFLVELLEQRARYFQAAAAIARTAGIFHLVRRFDFPRLPNVVDRLERQWATVLPKAA